MRQDFKRVVSAALATVMVAQAGGVSALAAPLTTQSTTTTSATPTAAGMHQFTGTPALIRSAIEDLKAQGVTAGEKKEDKALVRRVETASDKNYDTVKSDLAQALIDQREDGTVDVSDLGLTQKDMAAVLQETLYDKYMNHAVTDVTYQTEGGKVTGINYNMSEGFAAAMDAIDDEQQEQQESNAEVAAAVESEAAEQVAQSDEPVAISSFALYDAEGGDAVDSGSGDNNTGDTETECRNHTVSTTVTYKGDVNGDGKVDGSDLTMVREMILEKRDADLIADINGDGKVDGSDLTMIREIILEKRDAETVEGKAGITFKWKEVADSSPIYDKDNNVTNGGLIYNTKTGAIEQGILTDYHYELEEVSFTCSVCHEEIVLTDKDNEETLKSLLQRKDIYVNSKTETHNQIVLDHGTDFKAGVKDGTIKIPDGEKAGDYISFADMTVAAYPDDTANGQSDGKGGYVGVYTSDQKDNSALAIPYYYAQLSAFNAGNAEYLGVSCDYWTSKNSDANPMAAVKVLCNMDANEDVPSGTMLQLVQMLPQAFMAYVYYYGNELLAMREQALNEVKKLPADATNIQKELVLHDWLADNCTFDMGVMTTVNSSDGNPDTDPIQMTTFGSLLSDQLTAMPTYTTKDADGNTVNASYHGAICLGYTAGYAYLLQSLYSGVYKNGDKWKTPEEVGNNDMVDFIQAKFYADTANTSVAGEGFGGGAFNNVHYMNAVRLPDAENKSNGEWFYTDVCYDDIYIECMAQYRGEAQGSIYHTYFLMSPQSIAALYEKGKSIDYIDSLYDGYDYVIEYTKDADGNDVVVPSENIDKDKPYYDKTHPKYNKVDSKTGEKKNNNTSYENSWFSSAVSRIYNDGTNWYYVDGGSNMATQRKSVEQSKQFENSNSDDSSSSNSLTNSMDMKAIIHSRRVNVENGDKLKVRSMASPDYWNVNSSGNSMMDDGSKKDTYAKTLFDYGTGNITNANNTVLGTMADEVKQDFTYTEQYPGLTHSIGLYKNKLYFNLGNAIYTYDLSNTESNPVSEFKEYNEVTYSSDGSAFTATSYYVDSEGKKSVENKPIAALEIFDDYDFSFNGGAYSMENNMPMFHKENLKSTPTLAVSIATNFSFSNPDAQKAELRYTKEAVNLNPDYQRQISEDGDNNNSEFLWCANIRDSAAMDTLLNELSSDEGTDVSIDASCVSPAFTQKRTSTNGLVKGEKVIAEGAKANGHKYVYDTTEKVYICKDCGLHAYVVLGDLEHGSAVMTSMADSGMGSLSGMTGGSSDTTVTPVDPEREAATKIQYKDKDAEITLTPNPDAGYEVDEVYYKATDGTGDKVAVTKVDAEGNYTIVKPEDSITVFVTFKEKEAESHKVNIDTESIENGKVTADPTEAKARDKVTLTVEPATGYELKADSLVVSYEAPAETETQADDTETPEAPKTETKTVKLTAGEKENTWTFEMPAYDVKVTAEFVETKIDTYAITGNVENGKVTASVKGEVVTEAAAGAEVTLTFEGNEGAGAFEATSVAVVKTASGEAVTATPVEGKDDVYTFTMPAEAVTVTASYADGTPAEPTPVPQYDVVVTVNNEKGGTATSNAAGDKAPVGSIVKLDIKTNDGWNVWGVTLNGKSLEAAADKSYSFTMPNETANVEVQFVEADGSSEDKTPDTDPPATSDAE